MSEKELEKVNTPSDDASDKLSDKNAEKVVGGGYEDPSVQGMGGSGEVAGVFFIPVLIATNVNVTVNANVSANVNTVANVNASVNVNVNGNTNVNTIDAGGDGDNS